MDEAPNPAPDHTDDIRDQHIADLRAALQRVIPLFSFSAGREAVTNPTHSRLLSASADDLTDILNRTTPLSAQLRTPARAASPRSSGVVRPETSSPESSAFTVGRAWVSSEASRSAASSASTHLSRRPHRA